MFKKEITLKMTGETSEVFFKFEAALKSDKRLRKFILMSTSYTGGTEIKIIHAIIGDIKIAC